MSLVEQYDAIYKPPVIQQKLSDIVMRGWPRQRFEAILYAVPRGDTVLDLGCGDGYLLYQLRHHYKKLVGLELSPSRLEQARLNLSGLPFSPLLGSAENMMEIESGSLDCIVSADTIEHIPDVYAAVSEMFRVLKDGGTLVVNTPNVAFVKKRFQLLLGRFPSTSQPNEGFGSDLLYDGGHLHYFTFRSLAILLRRSGFIVLRSMGYGKFGRIQDAFPALTSGGVQIVARKPFYFERQ